MATFPIDHVYPKSLGGDQAMENLALTCPHCNAYKWTSVEGVDLDTGETVPLFDPRRQTWTDHFFWNAEEPCELNGRTATGRATIIQLRINDPDMLQLRALLIELGIFND